MAEPNRIHRLRRVHAEAIYALMVKHLGLPDTDAGRKTFCDEIAFRKRFNLRYYGFPGDYWNEGGSPYPRVTCDGTSLPWATITAVTDLNGEIARYLCSDIVEQAA